MTKLDVLDKCIYGFVAIAVHDFIPVLFQKCGRGVTALDSTGRPGCFSMVISTTGEKDLDELFHVTGIIRKSLESLETLPLPALLNCRSHKPAGNTQKATAPIHVI